MKPRTSLGFALALILLVTLPISVNVLAESDGSEDQASRSLVNMPDQEDVLSNEPGELGEEATETEDDVEFDTEEGGDRDEESVDNWDEDEWEDDEWGEEEAFDDEEDSQGGLFDHAHETASLAESKPSAVAYTLQLLIESTDEENAVQSLEQLMTTTEDATSRRLIAVRLAELYAGLDQPAKIQQVLVELCR